MHSKSSKFSLIRSFVGFFMFLYFLFYKKDDNNEQEHVSYTNTYKSIKLNKQNYTYLENNIWILYISFENKNIQKKQQKIITKYMNFAVLHVDNMFCAKLATLFEPKHKNNIYLIQNGYIVNTKKILDFSKQVDVIHTFDLYFYVKSKEVEKCIELYIKNNFFDVAMFFVQLL